jgi:hypothetical protein
MYAPKNCISNFAFTPGPSTMYELEDLVNQDNTTFDNYGFREGLNGYSAVFQPDRSTIANTLPRWPPKRSRLYPTMDMTNESFSQDISYANDVNKIESVVDNWPGVPVELNDVYGIDTSNPIVPSVLENHTDPFVFAASNTELPVDVPKMPPSQALPRNKIPNLSLPSTNNNNNNTKANTRTISNTNTTSNANEKDNSLSTAMLVLIATTGAVGLFSILINIDV